MAIATVPVPQIMSFLAFTSISKQTSRKPNPAAERRREAGLQYYYANCERWRAEDAAAKERRDTLSLEDKMKANGQDVMRELERELVNLRLLDHTKFTNHSRAACRARSCYEEEAGTTRSRTMNDQYRIFAVQNDWRKSKHYYNVQCLDKMVDLVSLTHSKFFISGEHPADWGLLVTQWFKHRGCIDVNQATTWFEQYEDYRQSQHEWWDWQLKHKTCNKVGAGCECPPGVGLRKKPVVEVVVETTKEPCSLLEVLAHPRAEDLEDPWAAGPHNTARSSIEDPAAPIF